MNMRQKLSQAVLYGIADLGYVSPDRLVPVTREMVAAGVDIVQLRAKGWDEKNIAAWAEQLLPVCRDHGVPFILNDHPGIAATVGTDGVHVGQDDADMDTVRAVVGGDMLVGRSTHSLEQAAEAAGQAGTDYIGFGPLFSTPTKPDYRPIGVEEIRQMHVQNPGLPVFCIGGIKRENLETVIRAGASRVVIVSGILQSGDIAAYVRSVKDCIKESR